MNNIKLTYLDKIIHEMNGPLHNMCLITEVTLNSNKLLDEMGIRKNLELICIEGEKLRKMVNLLSLATNHKSNKINIALKESDLIDLVKEEVNHNQISNQTNSRIKIELNNKIDSCKAKVDEFWFKQLLTNLIVNAINHCEQGLIEIHTDVFKKGDIDYFHLSVSDEGCGIPEDELENIFLPMNRGSHSIGKIPGSGIGLAIAREVVEAHNGSILARNGSKTGAVFEVTIPLK